MGKPNTILLCLSFVCAVVIPRPSAAARQGVIKKDLVRERRPQIVYAVGEYPGSVVKFSDDTETRKTPKLPMIVDGLAGPEDITVGPDRRLYFNDLFENGWHQILRTELDGSSATVVWQWKESELRPSSMVFGPNGELYFGTTSLTSGGPTLGVWRIRGVASAQAKFNTPELLIPAGNVFPAVQRNKISVGPHAILDNGDLLIVYDANFFGESVGRGRVVRARAPNYTQIEDFVTRGRSPSSPSGLALSPAGEVLVCDSTGFILEYNKAGEFRKEFARLPNANQIAIADDGAVYASNAIYNSKGMEQGGITIYSGSGKKKGSIDGYMLRGIALARREEISVEGNGGQPGAPGEKPSDRSDAQGTGKEKKGESDNGKHHDGTVDIAVPIVVAVIGFFGTIIAALIGLKAGKEKGARHSLKRFVRVQQKQLRKAENAIRNGNHETARIIAEAFVDNTKQWRQIQENFKKLLNGRTDDLEQALKTNDPKAIEQTILTLKEGFEARAIAVEVVLEKSSI